jgi:hypothetical protein
VGDPSQLVGICAHDAGGAELVSSWAAGSGCRVLVAAEGPARGVFKRKLPAAELVGMEAAVDAAAWLLCGTSWQSDLERRAIQRARKTGKRVVAFLDHWTDYRERFQHGGEAVLPDELWVGDEYALALSRRLLPEVPVALVPNPYLRDLAVELAARASLLPRPEGGARLLFVSEPVSEHALLRFGDERHWGYTEHDAIRYLLGHLGIVAERVARLTVRPHPAETRSKYAWVAAETGCPVSVSDASSLLDDIAAADIVAGCNTMAMVVALVARKRVISCIPPGGARCILPHREIEHLQSMVGGAEPQRTA